MNHKDLNNWIMYYEIQKLQRLGFSISKIANYLKCNFRTVQKYLNMTEQEYEQFLIRSSQRIKLLDCYETFVKDKLLEFPETTAAQLHDWLKEHHSDFPEVSPRTVYNFVMFVRGKYNIPLQPKERDYFPVEELPYGEQAQVDFGEYNLKTSGSKRKKVRFFVMVLSRSRMKYLWFTDVTFTSETVAQAHEYAFEFFQGIPLVIVYDQDRTILVDENIGDVILTAVFRQYAQSRGFKLHFCRKSDPQSKGKVENVVQYVKKNFLYNRTYYDIKTLNEDALSWLGRTANYLPHNYTRKAPQEEFAREQPCLLPYVPLALKNPQPKPYHVRKTNVISFKGNFYMLPQGTYKGTGTQVNVEEKQGVINIFNLKGEQLCSYPLSTSKGQTIGTFHRHRDTTGKIALLINQLQEYFTNKSKAEEWLHHIQDKYPRYTRDHLLLIRETLTRYKENGEIPDKTLDFCIKNELVSGTEFRDVFYCLWDQNLSGKQILTPITLLNETNLLKINETPQVSNIDDYESIINN
jgi:transposase